VTLQLQRSAQTAYVLAVNVRGCVFKLSTGGSIFSHVRFRGPFKKKCLLSNRTAAFFSCLANVSPSQGLFALNDVHMSIFTGIPTVLRGPSRLLLCWHHTLLSLPKTKSRHSSPRAPKTANLKSMLKEKRLGSRAHCAHVPSSHLFLMLQVRYLHEF